MKNIILIILLFAGIGLNGQTITGDKVITRTQLELAGYKVTGISNDTLMGDNSIMKLVTQYAVKNYVENYVTANSLPSQGGNSGKYLTTNGAAASWNTLPDGSSTNEIQTIDTLTVANNLLRLKLSSSPVKTLAMSNFITTPSGSSGQVQYNNASSFGALDSFTVAANPDRVGIGVPTPTARLDIQGSGSTSATNALRVRNSAGTYALKVKDDSQIEVLSTTEASKSSLLLSGTGFSGGTSTTTKPTLLIEPTGTTSTGWSTSGTKLGVNAESGFTGRGFDIQLNGITKLNFLPSSCVLSISRPADGTSALVLTGSPSTSTINGNTGLLALQSSGGTAILIDASQRVSIANGTSPNARAQLDVISTSRGFLPPRMTTTQRDAVSWVSGDAGMMIFNTTLVKLQVWNGTAWETITSI